VVRGWVNTVWWPSFALLLVLGAGGVAHGQGAAGQEDARKAEAKQRFEQAVADYDAGRYDQALANFQEAFRLRPHPLVNVNIANCYDKLDKPLLAIFHFERFMEAKAGTPAQQAEVTAALARLRKQVGTLVLRVTPDGALVIVDHEQQRRAPILEPMQLQAGEHTLEVQLEGYATVERKVIVSGGASFELDVALERTHAEPPPIVVAPAPGPAEPIPAVAPPPAPIAAPAPPPESAPYAAAPPPAPARRSTRTGAWIAGGISAALLVAGTVTGALALGADSDFDDARDRFATAAAANDRVAAYSDAADAQDRAQGLALATDVLLGAALVGAAITTLLFLTQGKAEPEARPTEKGKLKPTASGALLPF
jgi:tetratricopeptide (TPR) repeat protein